jgi:hypothetical protein
VNTECTKCNPAVLETFQTYRAPLLPVKPASWLSGAARALLAQLALRAIGSALGFSTYRSCSERTKPESYLNSIKDLLRFSAFTAETHREALFPIVVRGRTFSQLVGLLQSTWTVQIATASLADMFSYTKPIAVVQPLSSRFFHEVLKETKSAAEPHFYCFLLDAAASKKTQLHHPCDFVLSFEGTNLRFENRRRVCVVSVLDCYNSRIAHRANRGLETPASHCGSST